MDLKNNYENNSLKMFSHIFGKIFSFFDVRNKKDIKKNINLANIILKIIYYIELKEY